MLSSEINNISILLHEFNLKNDIRNEEDEIFGPYLEEERQNLNFSIQSLYFFIQRSTRLWTLSQH